MNINFNKATITHLALAKVGNPQRGESLHTSKALCPIKQDDKHLLNLAFTKPFKDLDPYRFHEPAGNIVNLNEMHVHSQRLFECYANGESPYQTFLEYSKKIARHLYEQTKHPNIKSGDLCIAHLEGIQVDGIPCRAISIIKSETLSPFLEISDQEGDLTLTTHNGISPEKIDKGCLILDYQQDDGFLVYNFDKTGTVTNFWARDFLSVRAIKDDTFNTHAYASMCVNFAEEGLPESTPHEDRYRLANDALQYLAEREQFDPDHFKEEVLTEPKMIATFNDFKDSYTDEDGEPIPDNFTIAKAPVRKLSNKIKAAIKLDSGVKLTFSQDFADQPEDIMEREYDTEKQMNYIKIYFNEELS